jgi:solute carrier family 25 S-adenosylmethionine transporter 26
MLILQVSCLIRVPTEIVKSRTQTGAYGPGKSSWHSLVQTMRYEGIRGFYRGFGITIAREVSHFGISSRTQDDTDEQLPFTSLQFPLYEALKGQLSRRYLDGKRPSPGQAAICGSIAGGFAAAVTCPLDVVKTRVMLEARVRLSPTVE